MSSVPEFNRNWNIKIHQPHKIWRLFSWKKKYIFLDEAPMQYANLWYFTWKCPVYRQALSLIDSMQLCITQGFCWPAAIGKPYMKYSYSQITYNTNASVCSNHTIWLNKFQIMICDAIVQFWNACWVDITDQLKHTLIIHRFIYNYIKR